MGSKPRKTAQKLEKMGFLVFDPLFGSLYEEMSERSERAIVRKPLRAKLAMLDKPFLVNGVNE